MTKLKWGMIGGGEGSQIGPAHRLGALADGHFELTAGALDHRPDVGREYAQRLGIAAERAYGDWTEMLAGERDRDDKIDLVTVATPNATHFEITKAFLEAGFNVLCEKPMTMTVEEGEEIVKVAEKSGKICAVNYCYSAYPMVRQARAMVRAGELGKVVWSSPTLAMAIMAMRQMQTIRVYAGVMIRRWRGFPASSLIAVSTQCIWPGSLLMTKSKPFLQILPQPLAAAGWKMTRWSISARQKARLAGCGHRRWPSVVSMGSTFRCSVRPVACAGRQSNRTS